VVEKDFRVKNERLQEWNSIKQAVETRVNINFRANGQVKFRMRPWSIWWFDIGENIGTETSSHFSQEKMSSLRPCVVVSTNNFHTASYNKKIMIMPLTSKKEKTKVKHFHYELKADNYKAYLDKKSHIKYSGLIKDSLVICNDIKTIDTKRIIEPIYDELNKDDIDNIKIFVSKYFGV